MLGRKGRSIGSRRPPAYAVLSHRRVKQIDDFGAGQFDAFEEADYRAHVGQHGRTGHVGLVQHHAFQAEFERRCRFVHRRLVDRGRWWSLLRFLVVGGRAAATAAGIETLLLPLAFRRAIVGDAPLYGRLPLMPLTAPEGATQVPPPNILRCGEKPDPARSAANHATLNLRMSSYGRVQRCQILLNNRFGASVLMPIRPKGEKLLHADGKKASCSVIIWIVLYTPSSYLLDAKASSGRARFLLRCPRKSSTPAPTRALSLNASPGHSPPPLGAKDYLKEGSHLLLSK